MLFKNPPKLAYPSGIAQFLQNDLFAWCQNIFIGLKKLTFFENFQQFTVEDLSIANGETVQIPNGFRSIEGGGTPRGRIIFLQTGNGLVTDGQWTIDFVELTNNGPSDTVISVFFFR